MKQMAQMKQPVVEHCPVQCMNWNGQKHEISCHPSGHETLPAVAMGKAPQRRKAARPAQPVPPASSSGFLGAQTRFVF